MKILLVDDEKELVSTLAERLEIRGMEAHWCTNGNDALKLAQQHVYDLALLDVKMPGISGIELKNRLKKNYPEMKFIFLTGHGSEENYGLCTAEGDTCLVKPIGIDQVIEKMNQVLSDTK